MAVLDALAVVGDLVRGGAPLVAWTIDLGPGRVRVYGYANRTSGQTTPAVVRDVVMAYADRWGGGVPQGVADAGYRTLAAATTINGVPVEVWGIIGSAT